MGVRFSHYPFYCAKHIHGQFPQWLQKYTNRLIRRKDRAALSRGVELPTAEFKRIKNEHRYLWW